MKIIKFFASLLVFLILYSLIGSMIDLVFNNSYTEVSYTIRRLIQLCLFVTFLVYITKTNDIKLQYAMKVQNLLLYAVVLFAFIVVYEGTIDVLLERYFTPDAMSASRESSIEELFAYPIAFFIQACISAPLFEEVLVRGALYETLRKKLSVISSVIICSILFSILHFDSFNTLFYLMIGFIFSYIYVKTGSITYCVILHMCVNAFSFFSYYLDIRINSNVTLAVFIASLIIVLLSVFLIVRRHFRLKCNNNL